MLYFCTVKKRPAIVVISVLAVLITLLVLSLMGGAYMVKFALLPENDFDEAAEIAKLDRSNPGMTAWVEDLFKSGQMRDTAIVIDGIEKHAYYVRAAEPSVKTAVTIHGYTSHPIEMMPIARMFRDSLGYNVILPHLHHHGLSGGSSIQMGWKDRLDVIRWAEVAHEVFGDSVMVVHGISMGGATTMMVSGEKLPCYIRGFIEDCGYTSAYDQFTKELKERFHLPRFPILYTADLICWLRYGWHFKEASSVDQVAKCRQPMLFIHGEEDDFVPYYMLEQNFNAKKQGYREMWSVPGVPHGESHHMFPAEYTEHVRKFLKEHVE